LFDRPPYDGRFDDDLRRPAFHTCPHAWHRQ